MRVTKSQEKWGAMTALLSLNVVTHFYKHMGLGITNPKEFTAALRESIVANRKEFQANPRQVPDLKKRVLEHTAQSLSPEMAEMLEQWFNDYFIWHPVDPSGIYDDWASLLMQTVNQELSWSQLGLPQRLSKTAQSRLLNEVMANANSEIYALSDEVDAQPRSKWDIEMYALHSFDDYDQDPFFIGVMPIVRNIRIKRYVRWLVESLNGDELNSFLRNANQLRLSRPDLQIPSQICIPEELQK